eukprot:TRINITY_DN13486_c0_g1_i1.p1 TRINITY_DN13486_c0_g1~~TRINITY_DN13486_c0_g1_i1.p1  ORF type:complete len:276 (+),score=47.52 TRINITY_DN13486_c0_g1_i1:170-997(+)
MKKFALIGVGVVCYVGTTYAVYDWLKVEAPRDDEEESGVLNESRTSKIYDTLAPTYDKKMDREERMSGITSARKRLVSKAKGEVLEVACGTGRNVKFYDHARVTHLTFVDNSEGMLKKAAFAKNATISTPSSSLSSSSSPSTPSSSSLPPPTVFQVASVDRLPFGDNSFDSVVQTFGLCSVSDPSLSLQEMARVCRPGGHILLLEHGTSKYSILNNYLDRKAPRHARMWGCWFNRDIGSIVSMSTSSLGLIKEEEYRRHAGTTYVYVLQKPCEKS